MQRRRFLWLIAGAGTAAAAPALLLRATDVTTSNAAAPGASFAPLRRAPDAWRELLDEAAFDVLFREATERPFSSPLNDETRAGTYLCAACYLPLFSSTAKYDSGTGWPSFYQPIAAQHVGTRRDFKLIIPRTEYHCARCGGHQGHVFNDGPKPTGQRWCNNGVALRFVADGTPLPELRQ
jgi:peptide-methionine (R)-S-oxide reductase